MKRFFLLVHLFAFAPFVAQAQLLLDESFAYSDGPIVTVSQGAWTNHVFSAGVFRIASQKASIQTRGEDVSRAISATGITNGFLYASMVVNFSTLPSGFGNYFFHYKDAGAIGSNFNTRARIFATTTNAAAGRFRVGIANTGNFSTSVPADLSLGTNYTLVVRYDILANENTTLWVDPSSESSPLRRADASDARFELPITAVALRQENGGGVMTLDDLKVARSFLEVSPSSATVTNPPSISSILSHDLPINSATTNLTFTVQDKETAAEMLSVMAESSNPTLVPIWGVVFGGAGTNRTVQVIPAAGKQGRAEIRVTVMDADHNVTTTAFLVTVGAPTIGPVGGQAAPMNRAPIEIPFTVTDAAEDLGPLILTGHSSNPMLVPDETLAFSGAGFERMLRLTPAADQIGYTSITLTVSDGFTTNSTSFVLTVHRVEGYVLSEPFEYPDGPLGSTGRWLRHDGGTNELLVANRQISTVPTNTEDLHTSLGGSAPYGTNDGWVLYAHLRVTLNELPSLGLGDYFAHFNHTQLRGRLFIATNEAALGKFRFGVANGSVRPNVLFPRDCDSNVVYTLVLRYDVGQALTTLWVDPLDEHSTKVTATDLISAQPIQSFSFRQSLGEGAISVDDLGIGTTFTDALFYLRTIPPVISPIASQRIPRDSATTNINFTVRDEQSTTESLTIVAASSNLTLVQLAGIIIAGTESERTVQVVPQAGVQGQSEISITVIDGDGNSASNSFVVAVGSPTIGLVPNQLIAMNGGPIDIPFSVADVEDDLGTIIVTGVSSNPSLVPDGNLAFSGGGAERTLRLTPAADQTGYTTITLVASDGHTTDTTTFLVTVHPVRGLLLSEPFDYADGPLGATGRWLRHGGIPNELLVANGKISVASTNSEDLHTEFADGDPYGTDEGWLFYVHLRVAVTELPATGAGDYFAHFNEFNEFFELEPRGRLFVTTEEAVPGKFRFGIANGSGRAAINYPQDLDVNVEYGVVMRYDVGQAQTTLWINPANERSPQVSAADPTVPQAIESFSFRQTPNQGTLLVDYLRIGTTFTDALIDPRTIPPVISPIARQKIPGDSATTNINFTVGDDQSPTESLTIVAGSSNLALVTVTGVIIAGNGSGRTVQVVPETGMQGQSEISITVIDGDGNSASNAFIVIVGSPTIGPVPNRAIPMNGGPIDIVLSVSDAEDDPGTLIVTGTSSNPVLVPDGNLAFGGAGAERTLQLTPAADQTGFTTITLVVSDGHTTDMTSFLVTVNPVSQPYRLIVIRTAEVVQLAWPGRASQEGYVLEHASSLPGDWTASPDQGAVFGEMRVVQIPDGTETSFFRLHKP